MPAIPRPQVGSYIFKFTPCGRFLISFDVVSQGVEVVLHSYKGLQASISPHGTLCTESGQAVRFDDVFNLHLRCDVTSGPEEHLLAFALVVYNDFLILASVTPEVQALDGEGEGRWLGVSEAVTLHLVDMMSGRVLDRVLIKVDSVHLTNQAAVSVWDNIIAILAPDLQNVYIVRVSFQGKFEDVRTIGSWCYEDDERVVHEAHEAATTTDNVQTTVHSTSYQDVDGTNRQRRRISTQDLLSQSTRVQAEVDGTDETPIFYGCLKQRLLAQLHKEALQQGGKVENSSPSSTALGFFYYFFAVYAEFEIHGVSLIDQDRLLLRWMPPRPGRMLEQASMSGDRRDSLRRPSATLVKGVYTLYNMVTTEIEALFKESSPEFTEWLMGMPSAMFGGRPANDWEQYLLPSLWGHSATMVRAPASSLSTPLPTPNNDPSSRPIPPPTARTIAALHLEGCQTHQTSPYLDAELYQVDERAATKNLVPRPFPRRPLKFIARTWPERLRFKFDPADVLRRQNVPRRRETDGGAARDVDVESEVDAVVTRHAEVIYLFHPHQPFAMTIVQNSETGIAEHLIFYTHDKSLLRGCSDSIE